jgi:hypothetical protein
MRSEFRADYKAAVNMETQGETGGFSGSGTAGSVCTISPSDLVGTIDNIITRMEKIETALMSILGANLHSGTLSELSQQVGWVYGVEYMGVEGWIQTEYGTLIPPAGFTIANGGLTLSDGNTYQAVVMDENGVLQFGFTPQGEVTGASVTGSSYLIAQATTNTLTTSRPTLAALHSAGTGIELVDSGFTTNKVELNEIGLYSVSMNFVCLSSAGSGTSIMFALVGDGGLGQVSFEAEDWVNHDAQENCAFQLAFLVPVFTANTTSFEIRFQGVSNLGAFDACLVNVAKIAGKAT